MHSTLKTLRFFSLCLQILRKEPKPTNKYVFFRFVPESSQKHVKSLVFKLVHHIVFILMPLPSLKKINLTDVDIILIVLSVQI